MFGMVDRQTGNQVGELQRHHHVFIMGEIIMQQDVALVRTCRVWSSVVGAPNPDQLQLLVSGGRNNNPSSDIKHDTTTHNCNCTSFALSGAYLPFSLHHATGTSSVKNTGRPSRRGMLAMACVRACVTVFAWFCLLCSIERSFSFFPSFLPGMLIQPAFGRCRCRMMPVRGRLRRICCF